MEKHELSKVEFEIIDKALKALLHTATARRIVVDLASEFRGRSAIRRHIYALAVRLRSLALPARKPRIGRGLLSFCRA